MSQSESRTAKEVRQVDRGEQLLYPVKCEDRGGRKTPERSVTNVCSENEKQTNKKQQQQYRIPVKSAPTHCKL